MAELTEARKAQMQALVEQATAGPWEQEGDYSGRLLVVPGFTRKGDGTPKRKHDRDVVVLALDNHAACGDPDCCSDSPYVRIGQNDLAFIAAARSFVPDALAHIETLTGENDELAAWKAREQSACLGMAVDLLDAGYKGDGIPDGIKWLKAQLAARDAEVARHVEAYKSAHDRAQVAEAEVARLTEERDKAVSELEFFVEHNIKCSQEYSRMEAALAALRASIHAKLNEDQWQSLRSIAALVGWTGLPNTEDTK